MKKLCACFATLVLIFTSAAAGDVIAAEAGGPFSLMVDLGCPGDKASLKPGWVAFEIGAGCDGQQHDGRGANNLGGSGINAYVTVQRDGKGNLRSGSGDPICNTYYEWHAKKGNETGGSPAADVILRLSGMKAGEYLLYSYHNAPGRPPMKGIKVTGKGVTQTGEATNVPIQNVKKDAELKPSLVKFKTDGSDTVTVTYLTASGSNAALNAFHLASPEALRLASQPNPIFSAKGVAANVELSWSAGEGAVSHNVYLGKTPPEAGQGAKPLKSGLKTAKLKPGTLELGRTYYWRVDEVGKGAPVRGKVWSFTVDQGKTSKPKPVADAGIVGLDETLSWTPGHMATSHDVFFGTSADAAGDAAKPVASGVKTNSYKPSGLKEETTYYWRVDAISAGKQVKGDVWKFATKGSKLLLKVDLALPTNGNDVTPLPGTLKPGWEPFCGLPWADMYMHDGVWQDGSQGGTPKTKGLGGSGVHVKMDCGGGGGGGFSIYGMCRNNLGGGGRPSGKPKGDPIANGFFSAIDWAGENVGDIMMRVEGLPAGEYKMTFYHNHWEPRSQGSRNCLNQPSKMPNIQRIYAEAMPATPPPRKNWSLGTGTGKGVKLIKDAKNIDVTSELSDDKVATSSIQFETDGTNAVLVIIDGGTNAYPDPARKGREGHKGILNAFIIEQK